MEIIVLSKLEGKAKKEDKSVGREAFSFIANMSDEEKKELTEKFKANPWKYVHARIEGELLGRVLLDRRNISVNGEDLVVVGIGGLSVLENRQKQGIGKVLMEKAIEFCKKNGVDLIFLNAEGDLSNYYKQFGFVEKKYRFKGISGKEYVEDEGMALIISKTAQKVLTNSDFDIGIGNV